MQVLRKLLFPFSLVYALIVFLRNRLYDSGILRSKSFDTKTICVGNLSVGGTGKTPMIALLVRLIGNDYQTAILSRGYKRKSKGFLLATEATMVEDLGDEPFQLKSNFPTIAVAVDANRRNGITQLEKFIKPEVILLDDAFQHRKVKPGFNILLTAFDSLYVEDWYLPTGNLRDSKREARRADVIIVTKCPVELSEAERNEIRIKLNPSRQQKVLFSFLSYNKNLKGNGVFNSLDALRNQHITLVTGIANPIPLLTFLRNEGLSFDHYEFRDHHFFTEKEILMLREKKCILTTEKDYVRLKDSVPRLQYIEVSHQFFVEGHEYLKEELQQFMKEDC